MRLPGLVSALSLFALVSLRAGDLEPVVEIEEDVFSYAPANNGAGPMWCSGSTCIVRRGGRVLVTGLETIPDAKPLNNCRWVLWERVDDKWRRRFVDKGRTREPSPLAVFHNGRVIVSGNPTLTEPDRYSGPSRPEIWDFAPGKSPVRTVPRWKGTPRFSEHSYRTLAADGGRRELLLLQNIGYGHAEWAFRDEKGAWQARGQLRWPRDEEVNPAQPLRLCYPNVALQNRAVYFIATGDIVEPNPLWRAHKKKLTGREWDYVFRRLYFTWTPDIITEPFRPWFELASREETAGHIRNCDLLVDDSGAVHVMWTERALDGRLREQFFPEAEQSESLHYARLKNGKVVLRRSLLTSTPKRPGLVAGLARFHRTERGRLLVVMHVAGRQNGKPVSENRIAELLPDGRLGTMSPIPLRHPVPSFFTATRRAGSRDSNTLDLFGVRTAKPRTLSYVRVKIE